MFLSVLTFTGFKQFVWTTVLVSLVKSRPYSLVSVTMKDIIREKVSKNRLAWVSLLSLCKILPVFNALLVTNMPSITRPECCIRTILKANTW